MKLFQYMSEVKTELQKASWPWIPKGKGETGLRRFKELTDSTIVIFIAMMLLGGFVAFWDFIMFNVVEVLTKFSG